MPKIPKLLIDRSPLRKQMKIGIFSKFEMSGGSEFRCVNILNAISKHTQHQGILLAEKDIPSRISNYIFPNSKIVTNAVKSPEIFYGLDSLIIVNTDCKDFSSIDYWDGKTARHSTTIDLSKIKQMVFLYNFLISPSRHLHLIQERCNDIRILVTSKKFFNEIDEQDRYKNVRLMPRIILESPIDPDTISTNKLESNYIRIGAHSLPSGSKWNIELLVLITNINSKYISKIQWDFMGTNSQLSKFLEIIPNVTTRPVFSLPVKDFLEGVDIFLFFPSWKREEPWSRVVAEAMASGCPVITTNKGGNIDQIRHGNNGYLCNTTSEFEKYLSNLIENPSTVSAMGRNSKIYSRIFNSQRIVNKILGFIE